MKKSLRLESFTTTVTGYILNMMRNGKPANFEVKLDLDKQEGSIKALDREARRCPRAQVEFAIEYVNSKILAEALRNEKANTTN